MFNKNKKNNKGFTLVELLVVIAIIGILAVVAVPSLMKNIEKSKVASLESDINAIKSASLSYYAENNSYPTTGDIKDTKAFDSLLESPLSNKFDATYATSGTAPGEYKLTVTMKNGQLSTTAQKKLTEDLSAIATSTGATITLIKGSN